MSVNLNRVVWIEWVLSGTVFGFDKIWIFLIWLQLDCFSRCCKNKHAQIYYIKAWAKNDKYMNEVALSKTSKVDCSGDTDTFLIDLRAKTISTSSASLLAASLLRLCSVLPGHIFWRVAQGADRRTAQCLLITLWKQTLSKDRMLIMVLISRMCQKTCFDLLNQKRTKKKKKNNDKKNKNGTKHIFPVTTSGVRVQY